MKKMVIKRDGRRVDFDISRIEMAIRGAISDCINEGKITNKSEIVELKNQAFRIANDLFNRYDGDVSVEELQDAVEEELSEVDYRVARAYAIYRTKRTEIRDKKNLDRIQREIIDNYSTRNSNANVDENTFSGKELRILEEVIEQMGLNLLPPYLSKKHNEREIYIHDLTKFALGQSNCLNMDYIKLLKNGFRIGQGDVKPAKHFGSFIQLLAVVIQLQSLQQFGGVGLGYVDTVASEYVQILIADVVREMFYFFEIDNIEIPKKLTLKELHDMYYDHMDDTQERLIIEKVKKAMHQGCQALITNLVTLQSRSGGQLPFSSLNIGYDTTDEGLLFSRILLEEMDRGIGRKDKTAIFPIICFNVKEGINKHEGDKGFDNYQYAIEVSCRRHYPTFTNGDWNMIPQSDNPLKQHLRMGCRTSLTSDINANSEEEKYQQLGRGNLAPHTLGLPIIALKSKKIAEKTKENLIEVFYRELDKDLKEAKESLDIRYDIMIKQPPTVAPFMYENGTILDGEKCKENVEPALKHSTLAIGYVGVAEMCKVLFGKYHHEDEEVLNFAVDVITHIKKFCDEATIRDKRNYSVYATPKKLGA